MKKPKTNSSNRKIICTDLQLTMNKTIKIILPQSWNDGQNKLHNIQTNISEWYQGYRKIREMVLARLQVGYTYITYKHLLQSEEPTICIPCPESYMAKLI